MSLDLRIFKKRLKLFNKETLIIDSSGRNIHVYQGNTPLLTIDIFSFLEMYIPDKSLTNKVSRIESITSGHGSNVTFSFNNNVSKRLSVCLHIDDPLVKTIMKIFKTILPSKVFECLYQDFLDITMKCSLLSI